jgi:excinuclease UvrABC ATPase subunit
LKITRTEFDTKKWNQIVREDIEKQFSIKKNNKCRGMKLKNKINSIKDSKSNILQLKKRWLNLIQWTIGRLLWFLQSQCILEGGEREKRGIKTCYWSSIVDLQDAHATPPW